MKVQNLAYQDLEGVVLFNKTEEKKKHVFYSDEPNAWVRSYGSVPAARESHWGYVGVDQSSWAILDQSHFFPQVNQITAVTAGRPHWFEEQFRAAFGYAERVSELCQRLEKIETVLLDVVTKLDRSAQPQRSLWVPIESFAPEAFEILKPITAVVTPLEDGFEAGLFDANLYSTGDTEVEAVSNLKSVILETYSTLEQLGDSKLGPGPLKQRKVLGTLIRKTES